MKISKSVVASILPLLAVACTSTSEGGANAKRPYRSAPDLSASVANAEPSNASPIPAELRDWTASEAARAYERTLRVESRLEPRFVGLEDGDGAYWRDPEFQKRLHESFLSETDVEPKYDLIESELLQQFYALMSDEKPDQAITLLESNSTATSSAFIDMQLAGAYMQQERYEEAAAAMEIAVQKHPKFRRAWASLGQMYFRMNDHANAQRALTQAIATGATSGFNFGLLGFCYINLDDSLAAESAFRMAILLDPATEDWKTGLGQCLFRQQRYSDVIALCDSLIAKHPERPELWLRQANAYARSGQYMRAAENFEILDTMGKLEAPSMNALGDIYKDQELYDLAARAYWRAFEQDPTIGPDHAIAAARDLLKRGTLEEPQQLLAHIEAAFTELTDEQRMNVLRLRARLALATGGGEEEARILEEVVQLDPLDGDSLIRLGQYAERNGDTEKAVLYFERAEGLEAFEAEAKFAHARLLVGQKKYAEALTLLRRAQTLNPRESTQQSIEMLERISQGRAQ